MGAYLDFLESYTRNSGRHGLMSPLYTGYDMYGRWHDSLHGGERYASYFVPVYGQWKYIDEQVRRAEDYYRNTGEDALYGSKYGGYGAVTNGGANAVSSPVRMSRTLAHLYPAEVMENASAWTEAWRMKRDMFRAGREMADHWNNAWNTYNRRFD